MNAAQTGTASPRRPGGRASVTVLAGAVAAVAVLAGAAGCSSSASSPSHPVPAGAAQAQLVGGAATTPSAPPTEAATGAIVPAFPSALLPLPPGATVTASAVQRHDGVMDVSLSATTTAPGAAVLDFYSATLRKAGFTQTKGSMLPPGAAGLAFSRGGGQELLVVAVADRGGLRSFSVGGTVAGQH